MHATIRRYQGDPKALSDLARRVGESAREVIVTIPGFDTYGLAVDDKGTLTTFGVYDDKEGSDESTRRAAAWVRQNAADLHLSPPAVTEGNVRLRRVAQGVEPKYAVIRRYQVTPAVADEIVRRAEDGFVPIISQMPGFATYTIVDAGNGVLATASSFESEEQARASTQRAADWVKDNIASLVPNPPEVFAGAIKVRWRK